MKNSFQFGFVQYALVAILLLIGVGAAVSYRNTIVIQQYESQKAETDDMKRLYPLIVSQTLHGLDLGLRAYAVTQTDNALIPYRGAAEANDRLFQMIIAGLSAQKYPHIDEVKQLRDSVYNYVKLCASMVEMIDEGNVERVREILIEDPGSYVWEFYAEVGNRVLAFQNELAEASAARYKRALQLSGWFNLIILLLSIPIVVLVLYRLQSERSNRISLVQSLQKQQYKYFYHPGESGQEATAEQVLADFIQQLNNASAFIREVAAGNMEAQWQGLSEKNQLLNEHTLAGELSRMRDQLKESLIAEQNRRWVTESLAKFTDLLRTHKNNMEVLCREALKFLVDGVGCQQGVIMVASSAEAAEQEVLEAVATYAYGREKYHKRSISPGEGLAGQIYLEGEPVFINKVPQGYTLIRSGLGDAIPSGLLFLPMSFGERRQGIVELAFLQTPPLHKREFAEKATIALAASIEAIKGDEQVRVLLRKAQEQAEILRSQEEELRQNMEELEATHEELMRRNSIN